MTAPFPHIEGVAYAYGMYEMCPPSTHPPLLALFLAPCLTSTTTQLRQLP